MCYSMAAMTIATGATMAIAIMAIAITAMAITATAITAMAISAIAMDGIGTTVMIVIGMAGTRTIASIAIGTIDLLATTTVRVVLAGTDGRSRSNLQNKAEIKNRQGRDRSFAPVFLYHFLELAILNSRLFRRISSSPCS